METDEYSQQQIVIHVHNVHPINQDPIFAIQHDYQDPTALYSYLHHRQPGSADSYLHHIDSLAQLTVIYII